MTGSWAVASPKEGIGKQVVQEGDKEKCARQCTKGRVGT